MITTIAAMVLIILCINGYQISWWLIFSICGVSLIVETFQSGIIASQNKKIENLTKASINLLASFTNLIADASKKKEDDSDDCK